MMSVLAPSPSQVFDVMSDLDMNKASQHHSQMQGTKRKVSSSEEKHAGESEHIKRAKGDAISTPIAQASPKSAVAAPLVQLRNSKLSLKQKAVEWSRAMSTLSALLAFNAFLTTCKDPLVTIPEEHLHMIAKLTQESDKNLNDLAKVIKSFVVPAADVDSTGDSDDEEEESISVDRILTLDSIKSAIQTVAQRVNYGIDDEAAASSSSLALAPSEYLVPVGLQLWRWEVRDDSQLDTENREKLLARREERVRARDEARALFQALSNEERSSLLLQGKKKAKKTDERAAEPKGKPDPAPTSSLAPAPEDQAKKVKSDEVIIIDSDVDEEGFRTPSPRKKSVDPSSVPKSEASRNNSRDVSPLKERKENKKAALTPEQEAKQAEKETKKKIRDAKRLEKERKDAEREAKKQKEAQQTARAANFLSSFIRPRSASPTKADARDTRQQSDFDRIFQACLYKDLAPINRFAEQVKIDGLQNMGRNQVDAGDLLTQFTGAHVKARGRNRRRRGIHPPISVRESMRLITEATVMGDEKLEENGKKGIANLSDRSKIPMKLLHFESDRRPAWYGTWTRTTNLVRPRKPFGQDPVALDYSYDSDAEWEDVDPNDGDDVQDNDDKEEEDGDRSDEDSEMDDWLVDDLEEEDEEEGGVMPPGDDPLAFATTGESKAASVFGKATPAKASGVTQLQPKKKKIKPIGRRFESKLIPFSTGPHWQDDLGETVYDGFKGYQMEFLNDARPGLNPFTFVSADLLPPAETKAAGAAPTTTQSSTAATTKDTDLQDVFGKGSSATATPTVAAGSLTKAQSFSQEHLPALLQTIEGSQAIRPVLVEELKTKFGHLGKAATKTILDACLNVYAEKLSKKLGAKWVIKEPYRSVAGFDQSSEAS